MSAAAEPGRIRMVTFQTLTIERRFTDVPPAVILRHLGALRKYTDDAFVVTGGNLVVRLYNHVSSKTITATVEDLCDTYEGINRVAHNEVNDTGDRSFLRLYWWRGDDLDVVEELVTNYNSDSLTTWRTFKLETFGGKSVPERTPYRYQEEPFRYLEAEHGFYGLRCYDIVFPNDLRRPLEATGEDAAAVDLTYHVAWQTDDGYIEPTTLGEEQRRRLEAILRDRSGVKGIDVRELTVASDYVSLVVDGNPALSPRQTVSVLRGGMIGRYNRQFSDEGPLGHWPMGYFFSTDAPSPDEVAAYRDHDPWDYVRNVRYVLGWGVKRDSEGHRYAAVETFGDIADGARFVDENCFPVDFDGWHFDIESVDVLPRTVRVTVTCRGTYSPWVIGHWLKRQSSALIRERTADGSTVEWAEGVCVSTDELSHGTLRAYLDRVT